MLYVGISAWFIKSDDDLIDDRMSEVLFRSSKARLGSSSPPQAKKRRGRAAAQALKRAPRFKLRLESLWFKLWLKPS